MNFWSMNLKPGSNESSSSLFSSGMQRSVRDIYHYIHLMNYDMISSIDQVQEVLLLSKTSILSDFFASIGVLLTYIID